MTQTTSFTTQPLHPISLVKCALLGAGIALIPISLFLLRTGEPNPEWGKLWMMRPLIIVPLAGASGGVFYYLMDHLRYCSIWKRALANALSLVVYLIALWLGSVLGLAGTYWH